MVKLNLKKVVILKNKNKDKNEFSKFSEPSNKPLIPPIDKPDAPDEPNAPDEPAPDEPVLNDPDAFEELDDFKIDNEYSLL